MRTAVYRVYDAAERLLYVGASKSALTRAMQHAATKDWWPEVATIRVTWHPTPAAAAVEELRAIDAERPLYNRSGLTAPARRYTATTPAARPRTRKAQPPPRVPTRVTVPRVLKLLRELQTPDGVSKRDLNRKVTSSLPRPARKNVGASVELALTALIRSGQVSRREIGTNPVNRTPIVRYFTGEAS